MENNKTKVILLVAGEGRRLRPYTADRPKCMVKIDDIGLIDRQLAILRSEGLDNIVMIGGYKLDMLKKYGVKLRLNPRYYETNMLWTLFSAEDELEGDVIVSYGDIVYCREILQALLKSSGDISVVIDKEWEGYWSLRNDNPLDDAETLKLKEDGTIVEIGGRPKNIKDIDGQYIGLMKFSSKGIKQLKDAFHYARNNKKLSDKWLENAYMTDIIQLLIDLENPITSVPIYGGWIEIDTVNDLNSYFSKKIVQKII